MASPFLSLEALLSGHIWLALAVFAFILVLLRAAKPQHRSILNVAWIYGFCLLGLLLAGALDVLGFRDAAFFFRWAGVLANGWCLIRLVGIASFRVLLPTVGLSSPLILQDLVVAGVAIVWLLTWLRANHVDLGSLVAPSAVLTAVIGLSLQDTLGNILGGVALQFEESIHVGDWIKVDDVVGRVTEIRWRHTALETRNWETVVIPNGQLLKNRFVVLGRRQGKPLQLRRWVWFNVDFQVPPPRVIETALVGLQQAEIPSMASDPPPSCVLMDVTASFAKYAIRYWLTQIESDDPTDSAVRAHLYFALKRAGITLALPAHAVLMTENTRENKVREEEEILANRITAVRDLEIFRNLEPAELEHIARRLIPAPFYQGEIMTRQGAKANWLYIMTGGKAEVQMELSGDRTIKLSELGPGSYFGEMGLLTGAPRSATVIARSSVDCYRLDKESFQEILKSRPELATGISTELARRSLADERLLREIDAAAHARKRAEEPHDLLSQIRRFFQLDG